MKRLLFIFSLTLLVSCGKNGVHKTFYDNGSLKEYAEYKDGELHGTVKRYYECTDYGNGKYRFDELVVARPPSALVIIFTGCKLKIVISEKFPTFLFS